MYRGHLRLCKNQLSDRRLDQFVRFACARQRLATRRQTFSTVGQIWRRCRSAVHLRLRGLPSDYVLTDDNDPGHFDYTREWTGGWGPGSAGNGTVVFDQASLHGNGQVCTVCWGPFF